jgi:hypothetical protein
MNSRADLDPGRAAFLLGCAWLDRGQGRIAVAQLERALSLRPQDGAVHRHLAYALVLEGEFLAAHTHLSAALQANPEDGLLRREVSLLGQLAGLPPEPIDLPDHPGGRLRFQRCEQRTHHRSGWRYAMESLHPLHHRQGVLFEGFLEDPFAWEHPRAGIRSHAELLFALRSHGYEGRLSSEERRVVPFREPWVGFLHNPHAMPEWLHPQDSPQAIFAKRIWQESMEYCLGLFALSETLGDWLRKVTRKPVSVLLHPTVIPDTVFDFDRFLANPNRHIVQIGWWLRRLTAIDRLPIPEDNPMGYTKVRLIPDFFPGAPAYLETLRSQECQHEGPPEPTAAANTRVRMHLADEEYDQLLAQNIAFVDLYDASANNAVIECLARGTPLLVNRLPAVEEYLATDYPLYYEDHADAAAKAMDIGRLRAAHEHMLASPIRRRLDGDSFRSSVETSEVYQRL